MIKRAEEESPATAIHKIGKHNPKRAPLTTLPNNNLLPPPPPPQTLMQQVNFSVPKLIPPPPVCLRGQICSYVTSPLYKPPRIISQYFGVPFQIRIPTTELLSLRKQLQELREKCKILQEKEQQAHIHAACEQITKSSRQIEEHIDMVMMKDGGFDQTDTTQQSFQTEGEKQYHKIMGTIESAYQKITTLQAENQELKSRLRAKCENLEKVSKIQTKDSQLTDI